MVDLISYVKRMPTNGETLEAPEFSIGCGGKGANQAVAAAKYGSKVMMVTKVGDDIFADNTIKNFNYYNIDTTFVERVKNVSSGVAPIFVDPSGQNRILIIKGANQYLTPNDIDKASENLKTCKFIILQLEINLDTVYYVIKFAAENGIPVLLNPAPANAMLNIEKINKCDFLVPNETELESMTKMPTITNKDIENAAMSLVKKGIRNVIVTMGSRGSMWVTKKGVHTLKAFHVKSIDSSGAGDAFIGCFSSCYVKNNDVLEAMHEASAFAALSVMKKGTQKSYPSKSDIDVFLKKYKE